MLLSFAVCLRLNNLKTRLAVNTKVSVFAVYAEAIIYLLLFNLHDCTFNIAVYFNKYIKNEVTLKLNVSLKFVEICTSHYLQLISSQPLRIYGTGNSCLAMYKNRNTETGNGMRKMFPNIPENVLEHSEECRQTFWGMSPNITVPDVSWSSHQRCSMKTWCSFNFTKLTKENTCAWVFFKIKLQASGNYTKKTFFTEQLWRLLPCMT